MVSLQAHWAFERRGFSFDEPLSHRISRNCSFSSFSHPLFDVEPYMLLVGIRNMLPVTARQVEDTRTSLGHLLIQSLDELDLLFCGPEVPSLPKPLFTLLD